MSIIALIIILVLLGFAAWCISANKPVPISGGIKMLIYGVLFIIAVLVCLKAFGLMPMLNTPVPQL